VRERERTVTKKRREEGGAEERKKGEESHTRTPRCVFFVWEGGKTLDKKSLLWCLRVLFFLCFSFLPAPLFLSFFFLLVLSFPLFLLPLACFFFPT